MLQHVEKSWLHVEPEDQTIGNDILELENSDCHIEYAVEFTKIRDPYNFERNGYFMMQQPRYETFGSWDKPALWRYYRFTRAFWLRLDIDDTPKEVYEKNSTNTADEYLFVVLEEEVGDEARCSSGVKPKVVIVPKRVRYGGSAYDEDGIFLTWKGMADAGEPAEKRLDGYSRVGKYSEFYLHDCQGKTNCPGCHAEKHKPESGKVDETRECPFAPI